MDAICSRYNYRTLFLENSVMGSSSTQGQGQLENKFPRCHWLVMHLPAVVMEEVWGRGLYHALLQSCRLNHGPRLATFFLSHMTHRVSLSLLLLSSSSHSSSSSTHSSSSSSPSHSSSSFDINGISISYFIVSLPQGILPNERTFRHLLKFPLSPSDIDDFMVVSTVS